MRNGASVSTSSCSRGVIAAAAIYVFPIPVALIVWLFDLKGLFADFDTTSNRLGNTVKDKNARLAAVLKGVAALDFGRFDDAHIDLFGDAYEFLISNYAANAGKSGGEFFTASSLDELTSVYDTLQQQIGFETRRGDNSRPWVIAGTILVLIAAIGAIAMNRRLP